MSVCISIVPENLGDYFLFLFVPLETTKMSYLSTTRFTCEHCLPQIVIPGFFLVENRFFSHTIHSEQFPFPLLLLEPYFPSLPDLLSVVSSSEKKSQGSKSQTEQNKIPEDKAKSSYPGWTRQLNRRKKSPMSRHRVRDHLPPLP